MRRLRLLWNRIAPALCLVGLHRWQGLYAAGRKDGTGSGRYGWVLTCLRCGDER